MPGFKPVFAPSKTRHAFLFEAPSLIAIIKGAFHPGTYLLLGALFQSIAVISLPTRLAIAPAFILTLLYFGDALLQTLGVTPNRHMRGVILGRTSAQFPDPTTGSFDVKPASQPVVVFMLGARFNHPMSMLAPEVKAIGDYFTDIHGAAVANADKYGLLGASSWNSAEATPGFGTEGKVHQNMTVYYFRSVEGLNEFARTEVHRSGVAWWNRITKAGHKHIGIMHETYEVPAGAWETIYENFQPTGLGATSVKVMDKESGGESWVMPLAKGSKGVLRSQYGRMGRSQGEDNLIFA